MSTDRSPIAGDAQKLIDMRMQLAVAMLMVVSSGVAQADAVLAGNGGQRFPTRVDIDVGVRAQIESTTIKLELPPVEAQGDYTITVPSPPGGFAVGVDIDRGQGFVALPTIAGAPEAAAGGDSSLQGWAGTTPLVASLEDLAPGPLTVRVRFIRILRRLSGEVAFQVMSERCPARPATDPGAVTTLDLHIDTARDLTKFAATNAATESTVRGGHATASTTGTLAVDVAYAEVTSGIGVQFIAHRTPAADPQGGDAGYFMLVVDADPAPSTLPRSLSLVIDHSGSMAGDKIAQARDAARAMLDYLRPTDSFNIHIFDDDVGSFRGAPVPASTTNIEAARDYIKHIEVDGGTNIDAGIQAALATPNVASRFDATVLLSDGLATVGEVDDRKIIANAWNAAGADTRMFTFSVGSDADFPLMEALARGSRGRHFDLNNAQATRDLVINARQLFEDIRDVRLTDLDLQLINIGANELQPEAPPDLFSGGQVIIVGRYTTPGAGEVHVTGKEGASPFDRTYVIDAPAVAEDADMIKYVWATEKVRALMASIANGTPESEVKPEVEAIGLAYRIQTPFTHFSGAYGDPGGVGDGGGCAIAGSTGPMWIGVVLLVARRRRRQDQRRHGR